MTAPVIVGATAKHTSTIIFLHGLGDTGHGWSSHFASIKPAYTKVICPTASSMPVTLNGGMRMPSWFDLKSLDPKAIDDEQGIIKSSDLIKQLINAEIQAGIPANRIVLGGFSQGGALALYTGLTLNSTLGGIIALSSWLPLHGKFPYNNGNIQHPPILQCHGEMDPLVLYAFGVLTSKALQSAIPDYSFKSYKGLMHSSNEQEMQDVKSFIEKVLPSI